MLPEIDLFKGKPEELNVKSIGPDLLLRTPNGNEMFITSEQLAAIVSFANTCKES